MNMVDPQQERTQRRIDDAGRTSMSTTTTQFFERQENPYFTPRQEVETMIVEEGEPPLVPPKPFDRYERSSDTPKTQRTISNGESFDSYYPYTRHVSFSESSENDSNKAVVDQELPSFKHESVMLSLERTFFAAMNNAWLVAMGGIGLMAVPQNDPYSEQIGIAIICVALGYVFLAGTMHAIRLRQLRNGQPFPHTQSLLFTILIGVLVVATVIFQLYYGILYPFLQRAAAVTITNPEEKARGE
jgi:uncharacterized membrane protein YidH (DUF202 family)